MSQKCADSLFKKKKKEPTSTCFSLHILCPLVPVFFCWMLPCLMLKMEMYVVSLDI
jgi:hypothetical protein